MTELEKLRPWCEEAMQEAMNQCKAAKQKFHADNASDSPKNFLVEAGNCAVVREALEEQLRYWNTHVRTRDEEEMRKRTEAALSAPARNCDVGTSEEQTARLRKFCAKYPQDCEGCPCCSDPHADNCWLVWAQMPYEEGITNG